MITSAGQHLDREDSPDTRLGLKLALLGAAASVVCGLVIVTTLTGTAPANQRPAIAFGLAVMVAVPIVVGLIVWHLRPQGRFGPLLVATGFAWSVTTLAQSDSSLLYSIGRVWLWVVEPAIIYLILAFPSGRLTTRTDRALVAAFVVVSAILFLPTALLVQDYPAGSPLAACSQSCPQNAFALADSTPGFVDAVQGLRAALLILAFGAVALRLFRRIKNATRLMRRTLTPVLTAAIARMGAYTAFLPVREAAPDSALVDVLGWLVLLTLPVLALGFLVGLVRWRLHVAGSMEHLARRVLGRQSQANVRAAMVEALEDPSLEMAYWIPGDPGRWVGADVEGAEQNGRQPVRAVTKVSENGHPAVALIHDAALSEHEDFLGAAASIAIFATENARLTARLQSSLRELEQSRARIVVAADKERQRIERDLHDGAQQRLVALSIKLELADGLMDDNPRQAHDLVHQIEAEIEEALDDVRSLARGIYPSLLAEQGLREALRAAALRVPVPTTVDCDGITRYPAEVESAVYFSCLEALQNAVKHGHTASALRVSIMVDGELGFEVTDDGAGFDSTRTTLGQGLTNMRDRLAAVGGRLEVRSTPGDGTVVSGTVPVHALVPGEAGIPAD